MGGSLSDMISLIARYVYIGMVCDSVWCEAGSHSQVLVPHEDRLMGRMVQVAITSAGKHYVMGELAFDLIPDEVIITSLQERYCQSH